jgi:hypothetical protein
MKQVVTTSYVRRSQSSLFTGGRGGGDNADLAV